MSNEIKKQFKNLKEEYEAKKKQLFEQMKPDLISKSKVLFEKYPELNSFGIPAYTPYFNDGDVCRWGLYNDPEMIQINGHSGYSIRDEGYDSEDLKDEGIHEWMIKKDEDGDFTFGDVYDEVCDLFNSFPSDFYKNTFDEGAITVNRDGSITVEEYSHD